MAGKKYDWPPLLAPGRHFLTLFELQQNFVEAFSDEDRNHREKLFFGLEEVIQEILRVRLPWRACIDGSFVTKKPRPSDIDLVVSIDDSVSNILLEEQRQIIDLLNSNHNFFGIDSTVFFNFPRDHGLCGHGLDANEVVNGYGIEHNEEHLKGFVVLRLWETDVGLRICR